MVGAVGQVGQNGRGSQARLLQHTDPPPRLRSDEGGKAHQPRKVRRLRDLCTWLRPGRLLSWTTEGAGLASDSTYAGAAAKRALERRWIRYNRDRAKHQVEYAEGFFLNLGEFSLCKRC